MPTTPLLASILPFASAPLHRAAARAMVAKLPFGPLVQFVAHPRSSQRPPARVRQAIRDVLLVLGALSLLGAQALSTLHYMLVPHHLCAVHGVLEDGGTRAEAVAHAAPSKATSAEASEASNTDEHDACSVATRSEHVVLPARPATEPVTLAEAGTVSDSPGTWLKLSRAALLSRAPKTSPPLRA